MSNHVKKPSNAIYNLPEWRNTVEDHLLVLKRQSTIHPVEPVDSYRFHQDLSAYLFHVNIPIHLHWIIMRVNDYLYNWDFEEGTEFLLIPDENSIMNLMADWRATYA
nr:MAG TPA: baseplate wedge protein [Caudoviricetes sp.]